MTIPLTVALLSGGMGVLGVLLGTTLAAYLNFRFNGKQRELELYKILYPKRLEAAQKIIDDAASLLSEYSEEKLISDAEKQDFLNRIGLWSRDINRLHWMFSYSVFLASFRFRQAFDLLVAFTNEDVPEGNNKNDVVRHFLVLVSFLHDDLQIDTISQVVHSKLRPGESSMFIESRLDGFRPKH